MENNTNVELEENNRLSTAQEGKAVEMMRSEEAGSDGDAPHKKKYHSSAMYAGSKWHSAVDYVKPKHAGLNL